jgi:hypothetical protein
MTCSMVNMRQVITFLDSHISPQEGWLQVLMKRVSEDKRHVVMPIIDGLSQVSEWLTD